MKCRGCNKSVNNIFLDLGVTPPSNAFLNNKNQKEKIKLGEKFSTGPERIRS